MKTINMYDFFVGIPADRLELVREYLSEVENKKINDILTRQEIQHISDTLYMNVEHVLSDFTKEELRRAYSLLPAIDQKIAYSLLRLNPDYDKTVKYQEINTGKKELDDILKKVNQYYK